MDPKNSNLHGEREHRKENHMKKVLQGNETTKNQSFKKRFPTLKKKALELETLCNVKVGLVCFSRDGKVHTYPENRNEVRESVQRFRGLNENAKKEMNLMDFLKETKRKQESKNLDDEFSKLSKLLQTLPDTEALAFVESKLSSFKEKLGFLASQELMNTSPETLVCDSNTYGTNIIGPGSEESNWFCGSNTYGPNIIGSGSEESNWVCGSNTYGPNIIGSGSEEPNWVCGSNTYGPNIIGSGSEEPNWVCGSNTYGPNIIGSGLEESNWVCDSNTYGTNIIGSGLEGSNWLGHEYQMGSQNNNNLLCNFPHQQQNSQFLHEENSYNVQNYHKLVMPQQESYGMGGVLQGGEIGGYVQNYQNLEMPQQESYAMGGVLHGEKIGGYVYEPVSAVAPSNDQFWY